MHALRLWPPSLATILAACGGLLLATHARSQEGNEELAKKLANPVSSLISVPMQFNYDRGYSSPEQGHKLVLNLQPVVPFRLNEEWNLISRTCLLYTSDAADE